MNTQKYLPRDIPGGLARDAINAQSACNASGLVHSLSKAMDKLWILARENNQGTDWVNHHPIVTMFLNQLSFLNTGKTIDVPSDHWTLVEEAAMQAKGDQP